MDLWCRAPGFSSHSAWPVSFRLRGWGLGERMFTMLWSCLLPSLSATAPASDQRHTEKRHRGREHCIFLSIPSFPSLFCASFPLLLSCLYISCLRLPSKGQRALRSLCTCMCMCVASRLHLAGASDSCLCSVCMFPSMLKLQNWGRSGASHTHTNEGVITLCSHVIPQVLYLSVL